MRLIARIRDELSFLKGNILILLISWVLISFVKEMPDTYYSLYVLGLGATPLILGLIGSVASLIYSPLQFMGGYIADRYGRRNLIVYMTYLLSFTYLLYAIAPDWKVILIATVLSEMASLYKPALSAITADSLPPEKRGLGYSIITLIIDVVAIPSPLIAGAICTRLGLVKGMRFIYLITTLGFLVAACVRLRLRETLMTNHQTARFKMARVVKGAPRAFLESLNVLRRVPPSVTYLIASSIIVNFAYSPLYLYLVVYAKEVLGVKELLWGALTSWYKLVAILSLIPLGKLTDKVERKAVLSAAGFLIPIGLLLFIKGGLMALFLSYALLGVGISGIRIAHNSLRADLIPRGERGKLIGLEMFAVSLAMALGDIIGGALYEKISPSSPFIFSACTIFLAYLLVLLLVEEPKSRQV